MDVVIFLYSALLFFVLTPGIVISIPPNGNKRVVAAVHAVVFSVIWGISQPFIWKAFH
jgi:hypothetical protein